MKAKSQSRSPVFKKIDCNDATNRCTCPCSQKLSKLLHSRVNEQTTSPQSNSTMHTPKKTSNKTFLLRQPQKMDTDMTTTLYRNQIKSLEDEIQYWKCRALQNETAHSNQNTLALETLKMENEKWKKKYMELQIKLQQEKLARPPQNMQAQMQYNPFDNDDYFRDHEMIQSQLKGELRQSQSDKKSTMKQVHALQMEFDQQIIQSSNEAQNERQRFDQVCHDLKQKLHSSQQQIDDLRIQIQELNSQIEDLKSQQQSQEAKRDKEARLKHLDEQRIGINDLSMIDQIRSEYEEVFQERDQEFKHGYNQMEQQTFQQQNYITQLLEEIGIWKTKVLEIQKQKTIELQLKEQDYNYNLEQLRINMKHQVDTLEHQLQTIKKLLDAKLLENEQLRKYNNQMAVKLNDATRLMTELESARFNTINNQSYQQASPERNYEYDSAQNISKDQLLFRMESDIKNLQSLLQEKQREGQQYKQQLQFINQNY